MSEKPSLLMRILNPIKSIRSNPTDPALDFVLFAICTDDGTLAILKDRLQYT